MARIRNALGPDDEPGVVAEQLGEQYPEMAEHLRTKIALLACGQMPPDDFEEDSIVSVGIVDDRSATIELLDSEGREIGDLVYFQSMWWIVVLRKDNKMVLKRC